MDFAAWCNRVIRFGFILALGLVPLLLTPWNYELFEYNKMIAVYAITSVVTVAWMLRSLRRGEFRLPKTPLDIPIALFFGSQLVSTLLSSDPHVSWLGYYSRFNGGMWSVICYILLYYAFVATYDETRAVAEAKTKPQKTAAAEPQHTRHMTSLLNMALITAGVIAVYGVLERLGIDKSLWVQDVQNRVFSTLGQPNWLAAYLVALLPVALAFAVIAFPASPVGASYYAAVSTLLFVVLLFTRSRSGLFGFVMADIVFWMFLAARMGLAKVRKSRLLPAVAVLHAVFFTIVALHGTSIPAIDRFITLRGLTSQNSPAGREMAQREATASAAGPALEVGGTESGTIRKYVWQAAVNAWKSSLKTILFGTGTETFAFAFYRYRPVGHNLTSEWDFLYNKAHNEYINYLATTGALGLGSYLFMLTVFILWFVRTVRHERDERTYTLSSALFAGWVSVLITNFFGFSVVVMQVFLFLIPAILFRMLVKHPAERVVGLRPSDRTLAVLPQSVRHRFTGVATWITVAAGIAALLHITTFWYADTLYARGFRLSRAGLYGQSIPAVNRAIAWNGNEPLYRDELAASYATLAVAAFQGGNATQAAQLATLAIDENLRSLKTSPGNVNFLKTETKVYYTLSAINPTFNGKAVEALERAIPLSPNDPKIYYNLAILVGRDGRDQDAVNYLLKAKALKPNYRDAYYALWVFYTEQKKTSEARAVLTEYLTRIDPNDKDFQDRLK